MRSGCRLGLGGSGGAGVRGVVVEVQDSGCVGWGPGVGVWSVEVLGCGCGVWGFWGAGSRGRSPWPARGPPKAGLAASLL